MRYRVEPSTFGRRIDRACPHCEQINTDGTLSYREFQQWARDVIERTNSPGEVKVPATGAQLRALAAQTMVPYVGFGIVDNAMMVMSGEAIDHTLGLMLGLSTLAAAALGNSFSNGEPGPTGPQRIDTSDKYFTRTAPCSAGLGMVLHGTIERFAGALGLPDPRLTMYQRGTAPVKNVKMTVSLEFDVDPVRLGCFGICLMLTLLGSVVSGSAGARGAACELSSAAHPTARPPRCPRFRPA